MAPKLVSRYALVISGVWLLLLYPLLNIFAWGQLPQRMRSNGSDFSQYYSGALAASIDDWAALYPEVNDSLYQSPPDFRPYVTSSLYDVEKAKGDWAYYPQVAAPKASKISARLLEIAPEIDEGWRYIYPPPLALLLTPLALFKYGVACRVVWFYAMCASLFGMSLVLVKVSDLLFEARGYKSVIFALIPAIPTWLGSGMATALYVGNVSPLIGFLVALSGYSFLAKRQVVLGVSMIVLILFKGIGILWCPLLLLGGLQWRALGVMATLTLLLNGLVVWLGGASSYLVFFKDILPKANVPVGMGVQGILMNLFGMNSKTFFGVLTLVGAVLIYFFAYRAIRSGQQKEKVLWTAVAGLMALFNLFNPVVWPHYFTCYLLLPFAPFMVDELGVRRGLWKWVMAYFGVSVFCWLDSLVWTKDALLKVILEEWSVYPAFLEMARKVSSGIACYVIPNLVALWVLCLVVIRLRQHKGESGFSRQEA